MGAGHTILLWKMKFSYFLNTVFCNADFRNIFLLEFEHHLATSFLDFILQREMRKNTKRNLKILVDLKNEL